MMLNKAKNIESLFHYVSQTVNKVLYANCSLGPRQFKFGDQAVLKHAQVLDKNYNLADVDRNFLQLLIGAKLLSLQFFFKNKLLTNFAVIQQAKKNRYYHTSSTPSVTLMLL